MHNGVLESQEERRMRESFTQGAPVLANLRNLAIAELRAATDALTGLPNRRAMAKAVKRMVAHASRVVAPLSLLLLDLDHFKQINDTYGHSRGDQVLASVGQRYGPSCGRATSRAASEAKSSSSCSPRRASRGR
ncbi:MAG TPA: diguanylate cyclase [Actinomycetota bacterium]|nr:diguanylate cyclase [Actinomycetota bacterium]